MASRRSSRCSKMRIAVFGATGQLGFEALKEATRREHEVVALVRNVAKLKRLIADAEIPEDRVLIADVNILDSDSISPHLQGIEAVVNCLGVGRLTDSPKSYLYSCSLYSQSIESIAKAMRSQGVKKIVCLTGWYLDGGPGTPTTAKLVRPFYTSVLKDAKRMELYLEQRCQDLEFVVVRPGILTNEPFSNKGFKVAVGEQSVPESPEKIPRANVAKFMLDCAERSELNKQLVAIGLALTHYEQ